MNSHRIRTRPADSHSVSGLSLSIPARPVLQILYDGEGVIHKAMAFRPSTSIIAPIPQLSCSKDGS